MTKPYKTEVIKSKGKAVYVGYLRVFEDKDRIHVTSSYKKGHIVCPKDSTIEKFFRMFLENAKE
ncbi:MAG: hypothetical protein V1802_01835 [Candidatus Aenigmatarchaeota archaeon]